MCVNARSIGVLACVLLAGWFAPERAHAGCGQSSNFTIDNRGRVQFENGTPIAGATVRAYRVVAGSIIQELDGPPPTGADGKFARPAAFSDPQYAGQQLGLLARITYTDPGTGQAHTITNYAAGTPFPPVGLVRGGETVRFPQPVVLQGGLWGGIETWPTLSAYLQADPASGAKPADIPAFMVFTVPNRGEDATWGYDNSLPWTGHTQHDANIQRLHNFITDRVFNALAGVLPSTSLRRSLPLSLCGHSMGGIITRGWMSRLLPNKPPLWRYVSFDGVHGGTTFSPGSLGFTEWYMNGMNDETGQAPVPPGWNYHHAVGTNGNYLLISSNDIVVRPNCSAAGVGRTMLTDYAALFPNGHKGRFIGGREWPLQESHWGVKSEPIPVQWAAQFLHDGKTHEDARMTGNADACEPTREEPQQFGLAWVRLAADAGTAGEIPIWIDGNAMVEARIWIDGPDALLELLDDAELSLIPPDAELIDLDGGWILAFSIVNPPVGPALVRLTAGSDDAEAYLQIQYDNARRLEVELPSGTVPASQPVQITARVRDVDGLALPGVGGSVEVTLTLPDQTTASLTLFDDGAHGDGDADDGVYGNEFTATGLGGRYLVEARAVIDLGLETVERSDSGQFVVDSAPGALVGVVGERAVDVDQNGWFEKIEIDIEATFDEPGTYRVAGLLIDMEEVSIASASREFEVLPGTTDHTATLSFDAGTLVIHGVNGPWTLTGIRLIHMDQALVVSTLEDHETAPYSLSDFEQPPAPQLLSVTPDVGPLEGGNSVTLQGQNLEHVTAVRIGGRDVESFDVSSGSAIHVVVPTSAGCAGGPVTVSLETPWTSSVADAAYWYFSPDTNENGVPDACECPADLDRNGAIGLGDLSILLTNYGTIASATFQMGDINGDGNVDLADLSALLEAFGTVCE